MCIVINTHIQYYTDNPWKRDDGWLVGQNHRENNQPTKPKPRPRRGLSVLMLFFVMPRSVATWASPLSANEIATLVALARNDGVVVLRSSQ